MRDRLLTFGLALAALAAFYVLLAPKPAPPTERPTRPLSIERGPNGYVGLTRWLTEEGISTVSFRERYDRLASATVGLPPNGHLLITTVPHIYPLRESEGGALDEWVAKGNTLFVVAGLSDTPDWSMGEGVDRDVMEHLRAMTGLQFVSVRSEAETETPAAPSGAQQRRRTIQEAIAAARKFATPQVSEIEPIGTHPLLSGVHHIEAVSEYPAELWRARTDDLDLVLVLAEDSAAHEPALWLAEYGDGVVIVSAYGSILTNKQLGKAGNARFLANVVNRSLGPSGRVILDDAHQGLVEFYDPKAFFGDRRLHATLWWLLGAWFVFVLGSQRLRPSTSTWQPVDITSFVKASGGFLARVLRPASAAQRLFANFFDDVARHTGRGADAGSIWEWLRTRTAIAPQELSQLSELHARAVAGRRVDPARVQTLLAQVRERLK
jgi:hypothetical protein